MLKTAVIGTGNMGRQHIAVLQALTAAGVPLQVHAIADIVSASLSKTAQTFAISDTSDDWLATVSRPDIDVVHICTPNNTHFAITKAALLNGKHVICEKPLGLNADQTAELVAVADVSGLIGAVCHTYRGYDSALLARQIFSAGTLGSTHMIRGGYIQGWLASPLAWDWRIDPSLGGPSRAMADIGSHWLDLASFITGESPQRLVADLHVVIPQRRRPATEDSQVSADISTSTSDAVVTTEDYGSVMFRANQCPGVLTVSQVSQGYNNTFWLEVDGSDASLSWHSEEPHHVHLRRRNEASLLEAGPTLTPGDLPSVHEKAMQRVFLSAYSEILGTASLTSDTALHATLQDGHRSAQLVDAIRESAASQQWTTVAPPKKAVSKAAVLGESRAQA